MGRPRPRVTFVTYEASRTGSPILLLRLLRWLHQRAALDLEVICWRGGPLAAAFREVADVRVLGPLGGRTLVETAATGANELGLHTVSRGLEHARLKVALRGRADPDLVYLNGVPSFIALPHVRTGSVPVLAQVHELEFALSRSLPPGEQGLLHEADRYLAVAQTVADNLVHHHGIDPDAVGVVHGFVDDERPGRANLTGVVALREQLGIPPEAAVVGAVGDMIWRKGADLFVRVAAAVRASHGQPVHFVWIGGHPGRGNYAEVDHDRHAAGVADRVHLVGEQDEVAGWYDLFDLLLLPSREDPFPLVMLEAAQAQVPVVSFDQGGAPEFLGDHGGDGGVGVVVPALDTAAMAAAVDALLAHASRLTTLGEAARARVQEQHLTSVVAPRLLAEIEALL